MSQHFGSIPVVLQRENDVCLQGLSAESRWGDVNAD